MYGLPVERQRDPRVYFSRLVFGEILEAGSPGKLLINLISSLCRDIPEWMPSARFKKAARDLRLRIERLIDELCQTFLELSVRLVRDDTTTLLTNTYRIKEMWRNPLSSHTSKKTVTNLRIK
jgi:hypothetical protein